MRSLFATLSFCALCLTQPALADVIMLKNGDRISGDILSIQSDRVVIKPAYTSQLAINVDNIASAETDQPLDIHLQDGTEGAYQIAGITDDGLVALQSDVEELLVAYSQFRSAAEISQGVNWDSRVDVNQSASKGNTDSTKTQVNTAMDWEWTTMRTGFDMDFRREEVNGAETQNKDRVNFAYNWLFNDPWYLAANSSYEQDAIALIDERISASTAIGYDIWNDAYRKLSIQFGPGYQTETVEGIQSESVLLDWRLRFSYEVFADRLEFYHNHRLYKNFKSRENTVFTSNTGIRLDVTQTLYFNTEMKYDHDSAPASDRAREDYTFLVGVGARFD